MGRRSKASMALQIAIDENKKRAADRNNHELNAKYRVYSGGTILYLVIETSRAVSYPRGESLVTAIGIENNSIFRFDKDSYLKTHRLTDLENDIVKCIESVGSEYCIEHEHAIVVECKEELKRIR